MADTANTPSIWNIGGALLGGLLGGGNSTKSDAVTKDPYAPAVPWINQNITSGQNLQSQYQAQPLSMGQIQAYGNSLGLTEGFRQQAPDLISEMNNMAQFDRSNPTAKPMQFNFSSAPVDMSSMTSGLLSSLPQASLSGLANTAIANATGVQATGTPGTSSYRTAGESWYDRTTPEERAAFFASPEGSWMAPITRFGIDAFRAINPWGVASLQESVSPGMADSYRSEASLGGGHYANYSNFSGNTEGSGYASTRDAMSANGGSFGGGV
jgi:hypothetical protein